MPFIKETRLNCYLNFVKHLSSQRQLRMDLQKKFG